MAGYEDIVGHAQIKEQLKSAIVADKVSHAYIFNGPKDSGKMMLAEAFAMALQCEAKDPCGCRECKSCKQAINRNQPDIIYVQHEKPAYYSIDEIRKQLVGDMEIKPYSSKYKVYIVDEAEKMRADAQNTILKTIEEPPHYGVILLLTSNAQMLLPTIRSRCVQINLKSVGDDLIRKYLMEKYRYPDYQANVAVAFAQGNVGKALALSSSEEFAQEKSSVISLVKKLANCSIREISDQITELLQYKELAQMEEYLDLMQIWFRDVLFYKSTGQIRGLIFQEEINQIKKQAEIVSYLGIQKAFDAVETARIRLAANGNFELTVEMLLLKIKEIFEWQK